MPKLPIKQMQFNNQTYDVQDNTLVGSNNISITTNATTGERSINIPTTATPTITSLTTSGDVNVGGEVASEYVKSPYNSNVYLELNSNSTVLTSDDSSDWGFYTGRSDNTNNIVGHSSMYVDGGTGLETYYNYNKNTRVYTYSTSMYLNGDEWVYANAFSNVPSGQTKNNILNIGNEYPDIIDIRDNYDNFISLNAKTYKIIFGSNGDDIAYIDNGGLGMNDYDVYDVDTLYANKATINEKVTMQYNSTDDCLDFIFE